MAEPVFAQKTAGNGKPQTVFAQRRDGGAGVWAEAAAGGEAEARRRPWYMGE